jgi:hypothetical protein
MVLAHDKIYAFDICPRRCVFRIVFLGFPEGERTPHLMFFHSFWPQPAWDSSFFLNERVQRAYFIDIGEGYRDASGFN